MKFTLATLLLCTAAALAYPVEEDKKQEKRGVLGLGLSSLSLPAFHSAPVALPAPSFHALPAPSFHAPIALPAPSFHAPIALPSPAFHAPIALPAPAFHTPYLPALPAIHAAPLALPAPAIHAPIALPALAAPAIKTIAAPYAYPSLSLGKVW